MSEEDSRATSSKSKSISNSIPNCLSPLLSIFLDSINLLFIQFPQLFFVIYVVNAFPLSLFVTFYYLSSTPRGLKSRLTRLEWLFQIVDNWIEAGNVRETSVLDMKTLLCFKALISLPIFVFSLFTAFAVVTATISSPFKEKKSKPTLIAIVTALRVGWKRPLVTCVTSGLFWILWGRLVPTLITAAWYWSYQTAVIVQVAIAIVEIYVMMVLSVALVVSIAEEKSGFEAVGFGSGLMKGRRLTGWVLSGLILMGMNCIGKEIVGVLDGQDLIGINGGYKWTFEMRVGYMIGLEILLGWVIMWSYLVVTIFYRDCKKKHVVIRQDSVELVDCDIEI